jgi:hypothetical protein
MKRRSATAHGLAIQCWCELFQKEYPERGKIALGNLIYDCKHRRVPVGVIERFIEEVAKLWASRVPGTNSTALNCYIKEIVKADPPKYVCRGIDKPAKRERCSRIVNGRDFLDRYIDLKKSAWFSDERFEEHIKELARPNGLKDIVVLGEKIRGSMPFAWVTKTEAISAIRARRSREPLPERLRDALGLWHVQEDEYLIEVIYPVDIDVDLSAPTFLEGEAVMVYRSKRGADLWGRTVHLRTLRDGLPEAVHPPIEFTDKFEIGPVGRLTQRPPAFRFTNLGIWKGCSKCAHTPSRCQVHRNLSAA